MSPDTAIKAASLIRALKYKFNNYEQPTEAQMSEMREKLLKRNLQAADQQIIDAWDCLSPA